jgi:hypothetical protein
MNKWQVGPVKLANGCDALIYRFCENRKVYIGELKDGSGRWFAREWDANGLYCFGDKVAENPFNLAPRPKKTVRVNCWLVIYPSGVCCKFYDKADAIVEAKALGFALIEINREVKEGDGL